MPKCKDFLHFGILFYTTMRKVSVENRAEKYKMKVTVQSQPPNATHFVGVAYPPNKISNRLKNASIFRLFYEICLALNSYK